MSIASLQGSEGAGGIVVSDPTLAQLKQFFDLLDGVLDAKRTLQGIIEKWGVVRLVGNTPHTQKELLQLLQDYLEGRIVLDRFALFSELLLSPADQLERLRAYDEKYWGGAICEELKGFQLPDVGLHPQRVKDLRVLHVEFGSPGETLERWWQVISATQPGSWRSGDLQSDSAHLGLHSQARHYPPGIHVVRLDLAAHWEPEAGRTLVDVYARVREAGEKLAHGEILSACGLHPDLVREMDGENLPFVDLAGYQVLMPGLPTCRAVPCLYWDSLRGKVALDVDSIDYFLPSWAAPVLRE